MATWTRILGTLVLLFALPTVAAEPNLKTDEDKTIYAIGFAVSRNLQSLNLTAGESDILVSGLLDGINARTPKVSLEKFGPKIQKLQGDRLKAAQASFLEQAAAEKGAIKTESGVIVTEIKAGSGEKPGPTDRVKVHYTGKLTNGNVFDSSVERGQPFTADLSGGVIKCWQDGLQEIRVGGKSKLTCPFELAYGARGRPPTIPPGATLVFEVELLEILN